MCVCAMNRFFRLVCRCQCVCVTVLELLTSFPSGLDDAQQQVASYEEKIKKREQTLAIEDQETGADQDITKQRGDGMPGREKRKICENCFCNSSHKAVLGVFCNTYYSTVCSQGIWLVSPALYVVREYGLCHQHCM